MGIPIVHGKDKMYSRSLFVPDFAKWFVPDFAKWFFVRYAQIYEAYVD